MGKIKLSGMVEDGTLHSATGDAAKLRWGQQVNALIGSTAVSGVVKETGGQWVIEVPLTNCAMVQAEVEEALVTKGAAGWKLYRGQGETKKRVELKANDQGWKVS